MLVEKMNLQIQNNDLNWLRSADSLGIFSRLIMLPIQLVIFILGTQLLETY